MHAGHVSGWPHIHNIMINNQGWPACMCGLYQIRSRYIPMNHQWEAGSLQIRCDKNVGGKKLNNKLKGIQVMNQAVHVA